MSDYDGQAGKLLLNCESGGYTQKYGDPEVHISSEGKEIFIVSDLHITEIRNNGRYAIPVSPAADNPFNRFITYLRRKVSPGQGILIINGDFIDFLRITSIPSTDADLAAWKGILHEIGINRSLEQLKSTISKKEIKYGLKTQDFKSVWKLHLIAMQYNEIFNSLAEWVNSGNRLVIIKGNHDLEFLWPAVRNYMRLVLAQRICSNGSPEGALKDKIFPGLLFVDDALIIDNKYFVEHGHKYDKYCHSIGGPLLKNKEEINMPFGSFFNRYLLNHIELAYPPFTNVRMKKSILPLLVEKRFFVGIRKLFQHIPGLFLIIPMRYYRYLFGRVLLIILTIFLPVLYVMDKFWNIIEPLTLRLDAENENPAKAHFLKIPEFNRLENMGLFLISFILSRASTYIQLEEPASLYNYARRKFTENTKYRLITFGHTHNPEVFNSNDQWFFNTGSWIPTVELLASESRSERSYTFLHIFSTKKDKMESGCLKQWSIEKDLPVVIASLKYKDTDPKILTSNI